MNYDGLSWFIMEFQTSDVEPFDGNHAGFAHLTGMGFRSLNNFEPAQARLVDMKIAK
jgi:hypothetical protein